MNSSGGWPDGNPQKYLSVDLTDALVAGQYYCLSLWMNLCDSSNYKTGALNAFLWYGLPSVCNYEDTAWDANAAVTFDITQVDSVEWTLLEGGFTANGGESNITLGAFQFGNEIDSVLLQHDFEQEGDLAIYYMDNVQLWACEVGVPEEARHVGLRLFPNPAQNLLQFSADAEGISTIEVRDPLGRAVIPEAWAGHTWGAGQQTVDVSALAPGQYLFHVRMSDGRVGVQPFVVAR